MEKESENDSWESPSSKKRTPTFDVEYVLSRMRKTWKAVVHSFVSILPRVLLNYPHNSITNCPSGQCEIFRGVESIRLIGRYSRLKIAKVIEMGFFKETIS
jgi:hypothetical protein